MICRSIISIKQTALEKLEKQNDFERNKPEYSCQHGIMKKISRSTDAEMLNKCSAIHFRDVIILQCKKCGKIIEQNI